MKSATSFAVVALVLFAGFAAETAWGEEKSKESLVGRKVGDFALKDYVGKPYRLSDFEDSPLVVVAFLGTECPLVKLYARRLADMQAKYKDRGVAFIGINANQQDSLTEIAHHARVHKLNFPVLKDPRNEVADQLAAERTPEVFLLDKQRVVRYHGRIDDQYYYEIQRTGVEKNYLAEAIDALLAGKKIASPETEIVGCHIGRLLEPDESSEVTYSKQISRILQKHCVTCHRPGEIAPFALTDYDEVVGWAEMIAEVVEQQRMPPWHADPEHGKFKNDARLSDEEKKLIYAWVRAGAPRGDPKELPPPREFVEGWRIGEPDQIVKMSDKPFRVPERGEVKYKYFTVDPGWEEDKYIRAAEARAGNRAVVHHIIVAHTARREARSRSHGLSSDWITAMAPGSLPLMLEEGMAKLVPAGSKLVFQLHYTPNGTATEDISYVGFKFADPKKVKYIVGTNKAAARSFEIPAGASDHKVEANYRFSRDSLLLAMFPHMHLRGKSFKYTAVYPDGKEEILLNVPRYDFNWQNGYVLAEPKLMPAGTRLHCEARFDNSEENLANPDPTQDVRWGDQTWEEMMIGYFDMCFAEPLPTDAGPRARTEKFLAVAAAGKVEMDEQLRRLTAEAMISQRAMLRFGAKLRDRLPQLDRISVTTVHEGKLTVEQAAHEGILQDRRLGAGLRVPAKGLAMARYADAKAPQINADISRLSEPDMRLFGRRFASSAHVPIRYGGKPGTVNFWSAEPNAFPEPAVQLLEDVAAILQGE